LELLLGNRAIDLNRAAAADQNVDLGEIISQAGRETVLPLFRRVLDGAKHKGQLSFRRSDEAAALYLDLLVGDLQIRRIIGRIPAPDTKFCSKRAELAATRLRLLLTADSTNSSGGF
jgi:hypothetical protein